MTKILETLRTVVSQIIALGKVVWDAVVPAAGILIASDIVLGTSFGVLERLSVVLTKFGITGNALTVVFIIAVYQIFKKKA